jgi:tetratricopeptide (TPR) repeat protein
MFGRKRQQKVGRKSATRQVAGMIGYHGLQDWWFDELDDHERAWLIDSYQPMGTDRDQPLVAGEILSSSQTAGGLLSSLAGASNNPEERALAHKVVRKAEQVATDPLDRHFTYQQLLAIAYPAREDPYWFEEAVRACEAQIDLSALAVAAFRSEYPDSPLPAHRGFKQLTIIYDKQGRYDEAIGLCERAQAEGWNGDWDKRLTRLSAKRDKAASPVSLDSHTEN